MPDDNHENPISSEDEAILDRLIDQMNASTDRATATVDDALGYVAKSEERLRSRDTGLNGMIRKPSQPVAVEAMNPKVLGDEDRPRKKSLAEYILEMPEGLPLDDPEIRAWLDMEPVGREFGASTMEKFAQFSPDFLAEGRGDQEQAERDFNPTDEYQNRTTAPMGQLFGLINSNPEINLATLVTLCQSQGIDLVLIPRDGSTSMTFEVSQGKLYPILNTPLALDLALKERRIGVAKGKSEVPDPVEEMETFMKKEKN